MQEDHKIYKWNIHYLTSNSYCLNIYMYIYLNIGFCLLLDFFSHFLLSFRVFVVLFLFKFFVDLFLLVLCFRFIFACGFCSLLSGTSGWDFTITISFLLFGTSFFLRGFCRRFVAGYLCSWAFFLIFEEGIEILEIGFLAIKEHYLLFCFFFFLEFW